VRRALAGRLLALSLLHQVGSRWRARNDDEVVISSSFQRAMRGGFQEAGSLEEGAG
jgi:hypothetical protein